ncbi:hypothetical protein B0T09DRAFT_349335 [Sordaria sp. MPI-SDFR-AT-0083]|nr:hypothetical protein B0T09DRAFT_349335 [Sordaria sp. MPI-SDFR-AT-0083]
MGLVPSKWREKITVFGGLVRWLSADFETFGNVGCDKASTACLFQIHKVYYEILPTVTRADLPWSTTTEAGTVEAAH